MVYEIFFITTATYMKFSGFAASINHNNTMKLWKDPLYN